MSSYKDIRLTFPFFLRRKCLDPLLNATDFTTSFYDRMDIQDAQSWFTELLIEISANFQKVPGSAIFLRYVKSSYQNDPVRSAVELFLFLFAIRYLLAPTYKPQNDSFVKLSDEVSIAIAPRCGDNQLNLSKEIDELVDDWTPEPLVASQTAFEEAENEKRPVIVGYIKLFDYLHKTDSL